MFKSVNNSRLLLILIIYPKNYQISLVKVQTTKISGFDQTILWILGFTNIDKISEKFGHLQTVAFTSICTFTILRT